MKFIFFYLLISFQLSVARDIDSVDLEPSNYEIAHVYGDFGSLSFIRPSKGDVLKFDPNSILKNKEGKLRFQSGKHPVGNPYLPIPNFRLETVLYEKGRIIGYSFVSRYGAKGSSSSMKLRLDLKTGSNAMFLIYEYKEIIHGMISFKKAP